MITLKAHKKNLPNLVAYLLECVHTLVKMGLGPYPMNDYHIHLAKQTNNLFLLNVDMDYGPITTFLIRVSCPNPFTNENFVDTKYFMETCSFMPHWHCNSITNVTPIAYGIRCSSCEYDALELAKHLGITIRRKCLQDNIIKAKTIQYVIMRSGNEQSMGNEFVVRIHFDYEQGQIVGQVPLPLPISCEQKQMKKRNVWCCICLGKLNSNVITTTCEHSFHTSCIQKLWNHNSTNFSCPLCRQQITKCYRVKPRRKNIASKVSAVSISARVKWRRRIHKSK